MGIRYFLLGLAFCHVITAAVCSLFSVYYADPSNSFYQSFIILLFLATGQSWLSQIFLFSFFYFLIKYFSDKTYSLIIFSLLLLFAAFIFLSVIIYFDWNLSKKTYSTFKEYIFTGNYYAVYAVCVVLFFNHNRNKVSN